jgi:hypothetical protein
VRGGRGEGGVGAGTRGGDKTAGKGRLGNFALKKTTLEILFFLHCMGII